MRQVSELTLELEMTPDQDAAGSPTEKTSDAHNDPKMARLAERWQKRIKREQELHKDARESAQTAWETYNNQRSDSLDVYYPLLWSVTQIQHSAVYSSRPIPDIRPRNTSRDPLYAQAANVMQRALEFFLDQTSFDDQYNRCVDDFLIAGLSVPRVKLDAEIVDVPAIDEETGEPILDEAGEPTTEPVVTSQMIRIEHHPWDRFGWEPCTNFDHCDWIYFAHELTPAQVRRRWGKDVDLPSEEETTKRTKKVEQKGRMCVVYEVWDKRNKKVLVVAKGVPYPYEVIDDPLKLTNFWPTPRPIMLNMPSGDCVFQPDYSFYAEQDAEIQRLYRRAKAITEDIKATSLHDASMVEIEDWKALSDGDSIPVKHLAERLEGAADIKRAIMFWPNEERVQSLSVINEQLAIKRAHVDELLGISDIVRGTSNPMDGVGTNEIKERWAGIRLRRKQLAAQEQIRGLFRIMAELTVEHISAENLEAMTQVHADPQVYALLKNDLMRQFAIDVETDSTVAKDEAMDRKQRTELLTAIVQWVQQVAPAVAQNLIPADLGREILSVATDPYKRFSRSLDDTIAQLPTTQQQLATLQQKDQQIQQMQQENEGLKYAVAQFSQAEEQRLNQKSQTDADLTTAKAEDIRAGIPAKQLDPMIDQADIGETIAKTEKIRNDIQNPPMLRGIP